MQAIYMPVSSSSVGEPKIMNRFVVSLVLFTESLNRLEFRQPNVF
jgi:hypothetical protein